MIASTHLVVGAAVGLMAQEFLSPKASVPKKLFWAFTSGIISHIALDAVPHQEYLVNGFQLGAIVLVETGIVFMLVLSLHDGLLMNLIIFFGMAGGAMPDVVYFANKHIFGLTHLGDLGSMIHLFSHDAVPLGFEVNIYTQATLALMALYFVKITPAK